VQFNGTLYMKNYTTKLIFLIVSIYLTSCFTGAGTHGSLKGYKYQIKKNKLDSAITYVLNNTLNAVQDTTGNKIIVIKENNKQDTISDNYYSDGHTYLTIRIKTKKGLCDYIIRYSGNEEDWRNAITSEIFICYAYDESGRGGSEGNGGIEGKILKHLTDVFEEEIIENVNKKLNLRPVEIE
jgi:hypothetical protein